MKRDRFAEFIFVGYLDKELFKTTVCWLLPLLLLGGGAEG